VKPLIVLFICTLFVQISYAQEIKFGFDDSVFEQELIELNASAKLNIPSFYTDMSIEFGIEKPELRKAAAIGMQPGEIYLAAGMAKTTGKSFPEVVKNWEKNKGKGWGVIANNMNIKPGSEEFKALKGKVKDKKITLKEKQNETKKIKKSSKKKKASKRNR